MCGDEAADRVLQLLRDPKLRDQMGERGREHVRDNFLITRYLHDYLRMMCDVAGEPVAEGDARAQSASEQVGTTAG